MKVAFAGTPQFAATILHALLSSPDHDVGVVISQPDRRSGRGRRRHSTPVADLARTTKLPLRQPERISEVARELSRHDALVVAAYGQILRPDTLYATSYGAFNVHASLLPRYRGPAPVERAIMAGEATTGVTVMRMDEGLDTGPISLQYPLPIEPLATGGELTEALASLGSKAIVEALTLLETGTLTFTEQNSLDATYAARISEEDKAIRWEGGAWEINDLVRALSPHIGARARHPGHEGEVKIWRSAVAEDTSRALGIGQICSENGRLFVGCGHLELEVLELQVPGSRRLGAREFLNGRVLEGSFAP